ncbi:hypothetical protein VSDG_08491 [Cytospora chrysosperma]|uniref:Sugar phosphate transporter domain-containing protein n=1 Tax=Cytospora chrysosperma TaxID=252740 RepID=A0A423VF98_CYTCH|nr:hypothetical protein VSDG_08491 [Valsa sordida]
MAGERSSSEADRKLESGNAKNATESANNNSSSGGLHPAFYIAPVSDDMAPILRDGNDPDLGPLDQHPRFETQCPYDTAGILINASCSRTIVPIGVLFSLSLVSGNLAYLSLSVSFIQMLKATTAVATLLATWAFGVASPNLKVLGNVSVIVIGVVIASFGEIQFDLLGFIYQMGGVVFEALRLVMVQRLLSSGDFKMDPLVSLYYFAPACAVTNAIFTMLVEAPRMTMGDIYSVGLFVLMANACVAFLLNVSGVLLIGKTNAVVLTMSGILKDVLLVFASMIIFRDPVTGQQFFGYSISLAGLVYYRLGAEKLQTLATDTRLQIAQYRQNNPARSKLVGVAAVMTFVVLVLWLWAPATPVGYADYAKSQAGYAGQGTH